MHTGITSNRQLLELKSRHNMRCHLGCVGCVKLLSRGVDVARANQL